MEREAEPTAAVRKVWNLLKELGKIGENELLAGDFDYHDFKRLQYEHEAVVSRMLLTGLGVV